MRREFHVRFCEGGGVRFPSATRLILLSERHLRRVLKDSFSYYHGFRTHLGLAKESPLARPVEPLDHGSIKSEPLVGGLHHRYFGQAA